MDDRQGPTVQHKDVCSALYGSLDGRGVWGSMDTCICAAESLCCPLETITALLTGSDIKLKVFFLKQKTGSFFLHKKGLFEVMWSWELSYNEDSCLLK